MPRNVLLPFDATWHFGVDDAWVQARVDDIERVFTRVHQEVWVTMGASAAADLCIRDFARWLSATACRSGEFAPARR